MRLNVRWWVLLSFWTWNKVSGIRWCLALLNFWFWFLYWELFGFVADGMEAYWAGMINLFGKIEERFMGWSLYVQTVGRVFEGALLSDPKLKDYLLCLLHSWIIESVVDMRTCSFRTSLILLAFVLLWWTPLNDSCRFFHGRLIKIC